MAKYKINWSAEAEVDLYDILEFNIQRNGSATFSKKLYSKIKKSVSSISKNPNIGLKTEFATIRALITGDYEIIYEVSNNIILISMIWDCRRNPEDKKIGNRIRI